MSGKFNLTYFLGILFSLLFSTNSFAGLCEAECLSMADATSADLTNYCRSVPEQQLSDCKKWISEGWSPGPILNSIKANDHKILMYGGQQYPLAYAKCMMAAVGVYKPESKQASTLAMNNGDRPTVKNKRVIANHEAAKCTCAAATY